MLTQIRRDAASLALNQTPQFSKMPMIFPQRNVERSLRLVKESATGSSPP
jgi:hypothetical protein